MPRSLSLLLALLRASACTISAGEFKRPDWASDEKPQLMRGRLTQTRGSHSVTAPLQTYLELGGRNYYLIVDTDVALKAYINLDVEVKGWIGREEGIQLLSVVQQPLVLVPGWWSLPFMLLLAAIALLPFVNKHFWEHHYHHVAIAAGALVVAVYLSFLGGYGQRRMSEVALDYLKFIALIGSLFVVTGGVLIDLRGSGRPVVNTALLGCGALVANLFGTTGASALLIRPFLRINKGRLRPFHVVLFIFIVANCGGALTPIGDPPLFLGYINGVPFNWTLQHCWPAWLFCIGALLVVFYVLDRFAALNEPPSEPTRVRLSGRRNFLWLGVVLFAVFLDKLLAEHVSQRLAHYPLGAVLMLLAAAAAYKGSSAENLARNEFSFGPIREVAYLFVGIFATMVPALDYLEANAGHLGISSPGAFYFASGALSSILDNAPTYLNFLTAAHGLKELPLSRENMVLFVNQYPEYLLAISLGSVFFGACTYIGNGLNFMVKAIAEASGAQTPGFFGYIIKYTLLILIPIYVLVWALFL